MKHRIVVLGAGYTGAIAAGRLAGRLHPEGTEITVVNADAEFVERVRMHQLATGQELKRRKLTDIYAGTGVHVRHARVTAVDVDRKTVALADENGVGEIAYDIGPPKQRVLFAVLALNANNLVSRDDLIDHLWGEAPPVTAVGVASASGPHARPAALFVQAATASPVPVTIRTGSKKAVPASSMLSVLSLGATSGTEVVLEADGEGAEELPATDLDATTAHG